MNLRDETAINGGRMLVNRSVGRSKCRSANLVPFVRTQYRQCKAFRLPGFFWLCAFKANYAFGAE